MKHLNKQGFRESIMRQFKDKKVPVMGTFEITGRCNFDCKMCYVHTKSNAEFLKTERNGEWWISIMEEACNRGMLFALITGGECLLHPDFRRIYMYLRSKGVFTSINTNGFLLSQEVVDFLKQDPPFEIQITLYGTNEETYDQVTGCRAFSQVRDSVLRVKAAGLNLKVAITPNPHSPGEAERIVKFLTELSVPIIINEALITSYKHDEEQVLSKHQVALEEKVQYLAISRQHALQTIPLDKLPPVGGGKREAVVGMKCSGAKTAFFMTQDGFMMPCPTARNIRFPVRSAAHFDEAWDSLQTAATTVLQPVECDGCIYKKACLPCAFLRCGEVGNGHCDPKVCEVTRRLVAAGVKTLPETKKVP